MNFILVRALYHNERSFFHERPKAVGADEVECSQISDMDRRETVEV
jgi:hypothetical protein